MADQSARWNGKGERVVFLNLRTTEDVRRAIERVAREQDRSMNWVHNHLLRRALGLDRGKEAA